MPLNSSAILDAVASHALSTGHFDAVSLHEPLALGSGTAACVTLRRITPVRTSGLSVTSVRMEVHVHVYRPTVPEPDGGTDPLLTASVDTLLTAYTGDFTLGGLVRCVDVFGAHGDGVGVATGAFEHGVPYWFQRVTLPVLVDDVFAQAA